MVNEALRAAVLGADLDPVSLGERLDVNAKTVERWITQGRLPRPRLRFKLAQMLGVPESDLWTPPVDGARTERSKAAAGAGSEPARTRRSDPRRRERLVEVALQVIAANGVAAASHRAVAEAADVPLGSTTYYFASLDDLHAAAIQQHVDRVFGLFRTRLDAAVSRHEVLEALVEIVMDQFGVAQATFPVTVELYALAVRKPRFAAITDTWVEQTRVLLAEHMSQEQARAVNAFIEGVTLHNALSRTEFPREQLLRELADLLSPR